MDQDHTLATAQSQREVAAIALSLRIPPFWRDKSKLWFLSFEAATSDLKKSQEQLAQMVIAQLEKQDIEQISDILCNPPPVDLYNALKNRLISIYEESDNRQLQRLLSEVELGDRKPTQLLRQMRYLAGNMIPDSTLRLMWTNHLPAHVRSVLVVREPGNTQTLDELALLADKIMESNSGPQVAAIEPVATSSSRTSNTDIQFLINEISKLSLEVAALKTSQYNRGTFYCRRRSSDRRYDSRRPRSPTPPPYCYYHRRFGSEAKRCTTPCSFKREMSGN